ncbi:tetratricopeptide repeat protein [uncultured Sphingomonas sp.]|uniref:tetratricopeptide repeat protein n=1 Tax=uncultured Sphingomonas sp. TaxID=158754 RepID=UPI0035CC0228
MGWAMLGLLGIGTLALMVRLGTPRLVWSLLGAALALGAAGYAWQGRPALSERRALADALPLPPPESYRELRAAFFGRFGAEAAYFAASDAALRNGDSELAGRIMLGAINYAPGSAAFWTELGNITALHDGARVSPTALFDYQQAMRLAPTHPGPPFMLGVAYVRAGDIAAARPYWARALKLAPANAEYRPAIAERLATLDAVLPPTARR